MAVLEQHERLGRDGRRTSNRREQPLRRVGLQRAELKPRRRIALDDELDQPVAQAADAVEQDRGRW
jgi:hypothetical protein